MLSYECMQNVQRKEVENKLLSERVYFSFE